MKSARATLLLAILVSGISFAAEPELKCDFSKAALPEGWKAVKGEWKVVEGALSGAELASDQHAAVFNIPDPHLNSSFRAKVRFDGAKGFHLSYNHAKGHLFRVTVGNGVATLSMDKDKKDPASKAEMLAKKEFSAASGEWVELSCSVEGNQVRVKLGDLVLEGTHPGLAKEKTGYRLVVQGETMAFDDIAFSSSK
ncbi:MAG: hypothetical protein KDN18_01190 [Verrucomicrobiae bacterium]|nr:hypothetical protein [Verrucomicrobiae bacterium]